MAPKPRFADGEKVLCFHGPLLYEAKCLKSQLRDKHMQYFIHYSGWNKNWDEWVPDCRVLKYNDVNLQKQKELTRTHTKVKKPKSAKVTIKKEVIEKENPVQICPVEKPKVKTEKRSAPSPVPGTSSSSDCYELKKKIKRKNSFEEEIEPEKEIKINIPPFLKDWLIDDNDLVTRQKKVLHLPARVTVDHIIAGYVKEKVSTKGITQAKESSTVLFANSIREYFNVSLGKTLLHKFERPQYAEILAEYPGWSMCQIYGAIHLLRLFTNMGKLLTALPVKGNPVITLVAQVEDFIRYMSENASFFNLKDYEVATPEYHRRAL